VAAHVAGLRDPRVTRHAERLGVAVTAFAIGSTPYRLRGWAGSPAAAAEALAPRAARMPFRVPEGTATGDAVFAALAALRDGPECERQVIDVATDGQSNQGRPMQAARDAAAAAGVVVNVVTVRTVQGADDPGEWAREHAVTPGGFVIEATGWDAWMRAIVRKLVLEVAGL
jgi:hypothetical protein